jgi:hypothetical protein
VASGGHDYQPKNGLPSYGFGPKASTTEQMAAAELYRAEQEALKASESRYELDPSLLKARAGEKAAGAIGLGATVAGALPDSFFTRLGRLLKF